eukprot:gene26010-34611_t
MPVITVDANNKDEDLKSISFKDKKFGKLGLSSDLLSSIIDDEVTTASEDSNENKKKKDKKKKKKGSSNSESSVEEEDTVVHDEVPEESNNLVENVVPVVELDEPEITVEQRVRREKPSSRVRFMESSQPDYVMMGMENVGLMYGNEVILKDATFSVQTGERVGLSTLLKILSGEIESTTGDIIKSSSNLRIAFLRQEFVDQLNMSHTLRQELLTSFVEERQLLRDIESCEKEVERTVDDPQQERMRWTQKWTRLWTRLVS